MRKHWKDLTEEDIAALEEEARIEAAKEQERKRGLLQKEIGLYKDFIEKLEKGKEAAKNFDGKVVNKRLTNALRECDLHVKYSSVGAWNPVTIQLEPSGSLDWCCYVNNAIVEKRLVHEVFCVGVDKNIDSIKEVIAKIEEDLRTGNERMEKFNSLVDELEKLAKTFSTRYKEVYKYDFHSTVYARIN